MNDVKDTIEWADYTWNPVTGCSNGCWYCYARKIHDRFNTTPFHDIVFHKDRLGDPGKIAEPSRVFVGSMSDFCFWTDEMWDSIYRVCSDCPQHTFLFLTKALGWRDIPRGPSNCVYGLTLENLTSTVNRLKFERYHTLFPRTFLSFEPVTGDINVEVPEGYEQVIVGAMTGKGAVISRRGWFERLRHREIFYKRNIRAHFSDIAPGRAFGKETV